MPGKKCKLCFFLSFFGYLFECVKTCFNAHHHRLLKLCLGKCPLSFYLRNEFANCYCYIRIVQGIISFMVTGYIKDIGNLCRCLVRSTLLRLSNIKGIYVKFFNFLQTTPAELQEVSCTLCDYTLFWLLIIRNYASDVTGVALSALPSIVRIFAMVR